MCNSGKIMCSEFFDMFLPQGEILIIIGTELTQYFPVAKREKWNFALFVYLLYVN